MWDHLKVCESDDAISNVCVSQALNGLVLPGAGTRVLSLRMGAVGGNKGTYPHPQLSLNLPLPPTLLNMPPNPLLLLHRLGQANAGPGLKQVRTTYIHSDDKTRGNSGETPDEGSSSHLSRHRTVG